jgi:ABC-type transport system involved in cytochrome c biogenesis permease subunit
VHYAKDKAALHLDLKKDRFSFNELKNAKGVPSVTHEIEQFTSYTGHRQAPTDMPLIDQIRSAGTTLQMLPLKHVKGEWVSLHAFHTSTGNFTSFADSDFFSLRESYFALENGVLNDAPSATIASLAEQFANRYREAYTSLAGANYKSAQSKTLAYPTFQRLQAERFYYQTPLIETTIAFYALALILLLASALHPRITLLTPLFFGALAAGFAVHTSLLAMRCFILQRPPVSNMFETVVYVPWIALITGLILYALGRSRAVLASATIASLALLILLRLTQVDARMENVQAVLDSQYWLIIHVLMVVGSYGAFAVCGILGHAYLALGMSGQEGSPASRHLAAGTLHAMYLGVGLLIPGTILGGVWAAESWGRFWDWDPKESWAFISACVYVAFIHAYTFRRIGDFGLAMGAVAGLMAISFTWYGVNYILGTGLHTYGFGSGGEWFYFAYLAAECLFLAAAYFFWEPQRKKSH